MTTTEGAPTMPGITENKISIITLDDPVHNRIVDSLARSIADKRQALHRVLVDSSRSGGGGRAAEIHDAATELLKLDARCNAIADCARIVGVPSVTIDDVYAGRSVTAPSQIFG